MSHSAEDRNVDAASIPNRFEDFDNQSDEDIMFLLTNSRYTTVAESTPSGTCATVSQFVDQWRHSAPLKPRSKICWQSKSIGSSELPQFPCSSPSIEEIRNCLTDVQPTWEDESFPANDSSLFKGGRPKYLPKNVDWKRPHELVLNPQLVTEGITRFDVNQGSLGDCWFLAPLAGITLKEDIFNQVLPPHQSFDNQYCGAFTVRFYMRGEWKDVVVDDRLPTTEDGKLLFLHSDDPQEFWPSLVEKAFAKVNGSYDGLNGGTYGEASSYFGAITESFNI